MPLQIKIINANDTLYNLQWAHFRFSQAGHQSLKEMTLNLWYMPAGFIISIPPAGCIDLSVIVVGENFSHRR